MKDEQESVKVGKDLAVEPSLSPRPAQGQGLAGIQGPRVVKVTLTKMREDGSLFTDSLEGWDAARWQYYTQSTGVLAHVHGANPDWASLGWVKRDVATIGGGVNAELLSACRMALHQFEFQYGERKRGWDAALLMDKLRAEMEREEQRAQEQREWERQQERDMTDEGT